MDINQMAPVLALKEVTGRDRLWAFVDRTHERNIKDTLKVNLCL